MKDYLFRGMIGGLTGGLSGFSYHWYVVNNAAVCYNCDKSSTPIIAGTLIGMAIACIGRR